MSELVMYEKNPRGFESALFEVSRFQTLQFGDSKILGLSASLDGPEIEFNNLVS